MLTDRQILKFQFLYKKHFNKEISQEEAYEKGSKLIRLFELIYKPMTQEEFNNTKKEMGRDD